MHVARGVGKEYYEYYTIRTHCIVLKFVWY